MAKIMLRVFLLALNLALEMVSRGKGMSSQATLIEWGEVEAVYGMMGGVVRAVLRIWNH